MNPGRRNFLSYLASWAVLPATLAIPKTNDREQSSLTHKTIQKLAFGSCAKQWQPQPIWNTVATAQPDLFLFLGDNIYGDWHGDKPFVPTEESLLTDYQHLAEKPGFATLRQHIPIMATWDNHDYGKHDGGAEFELKAVSKRVLLDFFGEPEDSERRQREGIYEARMFGPESQRVQVILLDNRWFRGLLIPDTRSKEERQALGIIGSMGHTPNDDPNVTLLGHPQWQWLETQLRKPADIRLIASGTQIVPDQKGMQEWGNFPHERQKLFDLIRQTGARGVILLSGNVHFAELSKTNEGPYPLYDFTSSGMTHNNPHYAEKANPYRVAGPYVENNFGLLEIDWQAQPAPEIILKTIGLNGTTVFEYQVSLAKLQ